jgi:hypothetical protein
MRAWILMLLVSLAPACGGDDDGGGGGADGGAGADAAADAATGPVACSGETSELELDVGLVEGAIAEPGERDDYRFTADAGTWVIFGLTANQAGDPEELDAWLRLYGPDGELVVENDDAVPAVGRDPEIVTRLPAGGEYCLQVLAYSDADGDDETEPVGDPDHLYALAPVVVDEEDGFATIDPEDGDELADAAEVALGGATHYILGGLDASDHDLFTFTMPEVDGLEALFGAVLPPGVQGSGSTSPARAVSIVSNDPDDGSPTLALIAPAAEGQQQISPPLRSGAYYLEVRHGTDTGADDFYVVKLRRGDENPTEAGEGNETLGNAEALTMNEIAGQTSGFITAELDVGDVDYFSFAVASGQHVSIECGAESVGSGVRDLEIELRDDADATVDQADEQPAASAVVEADIDENATYALRLAAGTPSAAVISRFVRCGVHLTAP